MPLHSTSLGLYPENMGPIIDALAAVAEDPSTNDSCKRAFYQKLSVKELSQGICNDMQSEISRIMGTLWTIASQKEAEGFISALDKLQSEIDNLSPDISIIKVMIAARFMLKEQVESQEEKNIIDPVALSLFNPNTKKTETIYKYALLAWKLFQESPKNNNIGDHIFKAVELLKSISSEDEKYQNLLEEIEQFTTPKQEASRHSEVRLQTTKREKAVS